jgi:RNA polymerase sigma-70 factor (ECF subfamily)
MDESGHDHRLRAEIPHLRRYARALLRDRDAAEDLLQDVLARAWSRLHLWRPGTSLRTWLFAIMHNLHANQVRDRARRPAPAAVDDDHPAFATRAEQGDGLELAALEAALARLPEEQRAVVLLVGLEELSYGDAAAALGVPVGTVMSRLHRGREKLRAMLAEGGHPGLRRVK